MSPDFLRWNYLFFLLSIWIRPIIEPLPSNPATNGTVFVASPVLGLFVLTSDLFVSALF